MISLSNLLINFIINNEIQYFWVFSDALVVMQRVEALRLVKKLKRMPRAGGTRGEVGEVVVMIDVMDCKSLTFKIIFMKYIIDPIVWKIFYVVCSFLSLSLSLSYRCWRLLSPSLSLSLDWCWFTFDVCEIFW